MMVYLAPNRWPGRSVALLNGKAPLTDGSPVRASSRASTASALVAVAAWAEASQRGHRPEASSAVPHREQNIGISE
jgi:hypothetical protein